MDVPRKLQPVCLLALPKEYIGWYCNHRCAMEISFGQCYIRTGVTQTLKGNEKHFELVRNSNYWDKFQCDLDQGKKNEFGLAGNSSNLCSSYGGSTTVLPLAVSCKLKQCI